MRNTFEEPLVVLGLTLAAGGGLVLSLSVVLKALGFRPGRIAEGLLLSGSFLLSWVAVGTQVRGASAGDIGSQSETEVPSFHRPVDNFSGVSGTVFKPSRTPEALSYTIPLR